MKQINNSRLTEYAINILWCHKDNVKTPASARRVPVFFWSSLALRIPNLIRYSPQYSSPVVISGDSALLFKFN